MQRRAVLSAKAIRALTRPAPSKAGFHQSIIARGPDSGYGSTDEPIAIPEFYVRHRQAKNASHNGDADDMDLSSKLDTKLGLMSHLFAHQQRDVFLTAFKLHHRPNRKVPFEVLSADGRLMHPSGFIVPTPADPPVRPREAARDCARKLARQTVAVAASALEQGALHEYVTAETRARPGKVPFEVEGTDGVIVHPSGFIPPTPAYQFLSILGNVTAGECRDSAVREWSSSGSKPIPNIYSGQLPLSSFSPSTQPIPVVSSTTWTQIKPAAGPTKHISRGEE